MPDVICALESAFSHILGGHVFSAPALPEPVPPPLEAAEPVQPAKEAATKGKQRPAKASKKAADPQPEEEERSPEIVCSPKDEYDLRIESITEKVRLRKQLCAWSSMDVHLTERYAPVSPLTSPQIDEQGPL
jgi:hypothetical protein